VIRARATFLLALALLLVPVSGAYAQPSGKAWRIGFLTQGSATNYAARLGELKAGLRDLGYREDVDFIVEPRYAEGASDQLPRLAKELVRRKVDVLVVHGGAAVEAKKATTTVPIVFIANPDPVGLGLVATLARPGGNLTGLSDLHGVLVSKRLELLKEVVPSVSRVAVLLEARPEHTLQLKDVRAAAPGARVTIVPVEVSDVEGIDRALASVLAKRVDVVDVLGSPLFGIHAKRVAAFAIAHRLPTISTTRSFAEAGLLMAYGANFGELYRRAATYVDRILKGAKPADLPVEQPTKFELVVNVKTAKAIGLTLPPSLLLRSDHVIE
jgi:putative ABC transport system substrate-binding protein